MGQNPRNITLAWLSQRLGGELAGISAEEAGALTIRGAAGCEHAGEGEVTFAEEPAKLAQAESSQAAAIIVPWEVKQARKPLLRVKQPRLAFAEALGLFLPPSALPLGVDPRAIISRGVLLGRGVSVGPFAVIGQDTEIADDVAVHTQTCIGEGVKIGEGTVVWPQVIIGWGTVIGARCMLHPGAVIGADGFGYIWDGEGHRKVPQIGRVIIGDDVEIGANTTIDRATTSATVIGRGTKIDNQVHIAHNVTIGEHCIIAGKVGISGSCRIGNRVVLAGQVGLADHVSIGDGAVVLARAAVLNDLPAGGTYSGIPAHPHREDLRELAAARKLPDALREIRELRRRLDELESSR